ncbi:MAG TPA: diaminopimelate epimerase [Candidatus Limnocylindrales bacterium]|nr:diaminopimelate epimerase [Candidatus Limnocylindrales bacterium]
MAFARFRRYIFAVMAFSFTKLHGCGNDYLFVDCTNGSTLPGSAEIPAITRYVSDRHTGVGSDGVILICPDAAADFRMEMYNADGSRGIMCGNGIRSLAKYVYDHGLTAKKSLRVATDCGVKKLDLEIEGGRVSRVRVEMGQAILEGRKIPVDADGVVINEPFEAAGRSWNITCVSMGNPHCVTFDVDPDTIEIERIGPKFDFHPFFPERVNTEFVRVDTPTELTMRVWERGSGETFACGTGACAALVAGVLTGRTERRGIVHLRGGDLEIEYQDDGNVVMTGPTVEVFSATIEIPPGIQSTSASSRSARPDALRPGLTA